MKKISISLLLLVVSALTAFADTNLLITHLDATEKSNALAKIGRLTFENDDIVLYSKTNEILATSPINSVRKITFNNTPASTKEMATQTSIQVYPNPTQDKVVVSGTKKFDFVRVFNMNGELMKKVPTNEVTTINMNDLPNGTYILQIATDVIKVIKK